MKTLTKFFNPILTENLDEAQYEIIENEVLKANEFKGLTISGSLFSLTTFIGVTFESCVFFGSKIENCEFKGCTFKNCSFQFTGIEHSNFSATKFENCKWDHSPVVNSAFNHCALEAKTAYFVTKNDNLLESCFTCEEISWEQALEEPEVAISNQEVELPSHLQLVDNSMNESKEQGETTILATITEFFLGKLAA